MSEFYPVHLLITSIKMVKIQSSFSIGAENIDTNKDTNLLTFLLFNEVEEKVIMKKKKYNTCF